MGTRTRQIMTAFGIASALGVAGVAGALSSDRTTVRSSERPAVHVSADALERQALSSGGPAPECGPGDFGGSADAYDRHSAACAQPVIVFYGSPDSAERQASA